MAKASSSGYEARCPHCEGYGFGLTRSEAELVRHQHAAKEHPGKDLTTAALARSGILSRALGPEEQVAADFRISRRRIGQIVQLVETRRRTPEPVACCAGAANCKKFDSIAAAA